MLQSNSHQQCKKSLFFDFNQLPFMGMGAIISWVHIALNIALMSQRQLVFLNNGRWQLVPQQFKNTWDYYFTGAKSTSNFTHQNIRLITNLADLYNYKTDFMFSTINHASLEALGWEKKTELNAFTFVPQNFDRGIYEWRKKILKSLFLPSPWVLTFIKERKNALNLKGKYISVHIRRGDKTRGIWKEDDPVSIDNYVEKCMSLCEVLHTKNIYVCSDSNDAIDHFLTKFHKKNKALKVTYDPFEERRDGFCLKQFTHNNFTSDEVEDESLNAIKNIVLISTSTGSIGCDSSYLFKVARYLGEGHFVSLSSNKKYADWYPL